MLEHLIIARSPICFRSFAQTMSLTRGTVLKPYELPNIGYSKLSAKPERTFVKVRGDWGRVPRGRWNVSSV
jgi:hypothetical protein